MGVTEGVFDVDKYFPSPAQQKAFLIAYFSEDRLSEALRALQLDDIDRLLDAFVRNLSPFVMVAEIRWVLWAVVQAGYSPVDFDYLDYANMRFYKGYHAYKGRMQLL